MSPRSLGVPSARAHLVTSQCAFSYQAADHPEIGLNLTRSGHVLTVNRNSAAMGLDHDGAEYAVLAHQPRFAAVDGDGDGVLDTIARPCEPARTNAWTKSQTLSDGVWTKSAATVATDTMVGPDGALAFKLKEDNTNTSHHLARSIGGTATDNLKSSYSFAAKAAERGWCCVATRAKDNTQKFSYINLATGALGALDAAHKIRVELRRDGWWRISVSYDVKSGGTTPNFAVLVATANGTNSYTGTTGFGIYVTDLQCETNAPYATSFIYTDTATAGRASDRLTAVLDWTNGRLPNDVSVYLQFARPAWLDSPSLTDFGYALDLGIGAPHLYVAVDQVGGGIEAGLEIAAGVETPAGNPIPATPLVEVAANWKNLRSGPQIRMDVGGTGFTAYTSPGTPLTGLDQALLSIGDRDGSDVQFGGNLVAVRIVRDQLLTLAQLQGRR